MNAAAMPQHLPGVLHSLEPTLNQFGYLAVLGLVLIEDFGVPVPGETALILGAVYAGTGQLSIVLVALLGFCGAVLGDNIGFALGHVGGRPLVERYGRYVLLTPDRLDKATSFFDRHGGKVVMIARFVEGLRQANGITAGTAGMRWSPVSHLQCTRRRTLGAGVDQRRLLLGQPYRRDLPYSHALRHLSGDRGRCPGGCVHRAARGEGASAVAQRLRPAPPGCWVVERAARLALVGAASE